MILAWLFASGVIFQPVSISAPSAVSMHLTPAAITRQEPEEDTPERRATFDKIKALTTEYGPSIKVTFEPVAANRWNMHGVMKDAPKNCDGLEIVVSASRKGVMGVRVFPMISGGYLNLDKAKNSAALCRAIARMNNETFFFWGADADSDVFAEFKFTLESGFPTESLKVVLSSIANLDQFVGDLRKAADGTDG